MYYSPAYDRDEPCYGCGSIKGECECTLEIEAYDALAAQGVTLTNGDYTTLSIEQRISQLRYWRSTSDYRGRMM